MYMYLNVIILNDFQQVFGRHIQKFGIIRNSIKIFNNYIPRLKF